MFYKTFLMLGAKFRRNKWKSLEGNFNFSKNFGAIFKKLDKFDLS